MTSEVFIYFKELSHYSYNLAFFIAMTIKATPKMTNTPPNMGKANSKPQDSCRSPNTCYGREVKQ